MFASPHRPRPSPRALRWALTSAVVVGLALPDCGSGSRVTTPPQPSATPPPVTLPPTPTTLADLSASVTSPQTDTSINCSDDVRARVTLTNRGGTGVVVAGVRNTFGIPTGRCFGGGEFTFRPLTSIVFANTTAVILNQSLYANGPGCCDGKGCAGSCKFQEAFEVITELGNVPAGSFNYTVFFQNCRSCATSAASAGNAACFNSKR
jgi:hypothetical protein